MQIIGEIEIKTGEAKKSLENAVSLPKEPGKNPKQRSATEIPVEPSTGGSTGNRQTLNAEREESAEEEVNVQKIIEIPNKGGPKKTDDPSKIKSSKVRLLRENQKKKRVKPMKATIENETKATEMFKRLENNEYEIL